MDVVELSRIQFSLTATFHFLFPPVTIGMAFIISIIEYLHFRTARDIYREMSSFLIKIFAIFFAVGVASGIIMEFQFGSNWARYSEFVGDIFGSPLAAEALFAFFLESTFLGVLLYGRNRVSRRGYFIAAVLVFVGSVLSAFWIIVANSWQQTPVGYQVVNGRAVITDFVAAVFNPSTLPRFLHTVIGSLITGSFFVMAIAAYGIIKRGETEFAKRLLNISLISAAICSLLELGAGHYHAVQVMETQPIKLAAFEGLFETQRGAPMSLVGIPDKSSKELKYAIVVPKMLSLLGYFDFNAEVKGLNSAPEDEWPPLVVTFMSYHIMIGLGMYFIGLTLLGIALRMKGKLYSTVPYLKFLIPSALLPWLCMEAGWYAAEMGRQPWVVYKVLKTIDGVSVVVSAGEVLFSIIAFSLIYLIFISLVIVLVRREIVRKVHSLSP
jgi:cytochrome d ubiquinol oxidase subunit I